MHWCKYLGRKLIWWKRKKLICSCTKLYRHCEEFPPQLLVTHRKCTSPGGWDIQYKAYMFYMMSTSCKPLRTSRHGNILRKCRTIVRWEKPKKCVIKLLNLNFQVDGDRQYCTVIPVFRSCCWFDPLNLHYHLNRHISMYLCDCYELKITPLATVWCLRLKPRLSALNLI